jgi:hypothetical protein
MSRKLSSANPYLRDPVQRERSVLKSVATSSAIEGIHAPFRRSKSGTFAGSLKAASVRKSTLKGR